MQLKPVESVSINLSPAGESVLKKRKALAAAMDIQNQPPGKSTQK
jgi:hypothetical protein